MKEGLLGEEVRLSFEPGTLLAQGIGEVIHRFKPAVGNRWRQ